MRQDLRQLLGEHLRRNSGLGGIFVQRLLAERLVHVAGGHGCIGAVRNPGMDGRAEPVGLQLVDDTLNAAMLFNQPVDDADHFGADHAADQSIQKPHRFLLRCPVMSMREKRKVEFGVFSLRLIAAQIAPNEAARKKPPGIGGVMDRNDLQ